MIDKYITLAHGNGGRYMRELIDDLFARHLTPCQLDSHHDAALLPGLQGQCLMTTDGYTVQPLEFPGGDIGSLAVHGTVNDLAVCGALPRYLSLNAFLEEGLAIEQLDRIMVSLSRAAQQCRVAIVTGDTKVLPRGLVSGIYLATTGIGIRNAAFEQGFDRIRAGDAVIVSGPVGDHGAAVMLAREQYGLRGDVVSDSASIWPLCQTACELPGLRFMRDPTRGGLVTVACDIVTQTGLGLRLREKDIPVREAVRGVGELLGFDPLYLACEGRVMAVVAADQAGELLRRWCTLPEGRESAVIGTFIESPVQVVLETRLGGERVLEELEDDPLPRIC